MLASRKSPPCWWKSQASSRICGEANLNKSFEEAEKITLQREEEDNPYIWHGTVNIPLPKGVFKTFPLFVKFYRGVKWEEMSDDDRWVLQSNEVYAKGFVEIQGKKSGAGRVGAKCRIKGPLTSAMTPDHWQGLCQVVKVRWGSGP